MGYDVSRAPGSFMNYEQDQHMAGSAYPSQGFNMNHIANSLPPTEQPCEAPPAYTYHPEQTNAPFHASFSTQSQSSQGLTFENSIRPHPTTTASTSNRLLKPIAIPATTSTTGSAFLRAYPPSLSSHHISQDLFLTFLDDLNRVAVQSPPLQVIGLAGNIVGFVPLATAQIVGGAVNVATMIGTQVISKGRTEVFLRSANKEIFNPRGLKVEVSRIDALAKIAGIPILTPEGKVKKGVNLLEPVGMEEVQRTKSGESAVSGQQRRLQALEPYIAHLELEGLPGIEAKANPLSKWSAGASEMSRKRGEKKMTKTRLEAAEKYHEESGKAGEKYEKDMAKQDRKVDKMLAKGKNGEKATEKMREIEKEKRKIQKDYDKETRKVEKDRRKDDKEESGMKKILWLVIRNLDEKVEG